MQCQPFEISAIAGYRSKAAWDATTTELVRTMLDRWHLRAIHGFDGGYAAATVEVITADDEPAVLKVGFPHTEAIWEAVALEAMGPELAPRVLRQDAWTWSMLLTEISPAIRVSSLGPHEALEVASGLVLRLRAVQPPAGLPEVGATVAQFVEGARSRRTTQSSWLEELHSTADVDASLALADEWCLKAPGPHLVHGDLNPSNILRDAQRGWMVIDPKPMIGDAAYDCWSFISPLGDVRRAENVPDELARRIEEVAASTGLSRASIRSWGIIRAGLALSWYIDDGLRADAERAAVELSGWLAVDARAQYSGISLDGEAPTAPPPPPTPR